MELSLSPVILTIKGYVDGEDVQLNTGFLATPEEKLGIQKALILIENSKINLITSIKIFQGGGHHEIGTDAQPR